MLTAVKAAALWLYQLIHPRRCVLCRKLLPPGSAAMLCAACAPQFRKRYRCVSPPVVEGADGTDAPLLYTGRVAAALRRYKFYRETSLRRWFSAQCAACLAARLPEWEPDMLTYVPLGARRWWSRGFNQNKPIAYAVGRALGLPVRATLGKHPSPGRQSGRNAAERQRAARQVFFALPLAAVRGKSVVLLDDVVTTGATAADAVRALRKAGASRVWVLAVSCTPESPAGSRKEGPP